MGSFVSGSCPSVMARELFSAWLGHVSSICSTALEPLPAMKCFKPKYHLPVLGSYREAAPKQYWDKFPKNLVRPGTSRVNPIVLEKLALRNRFHDLALLEQICSDLSSGANIGCKGAFRKPSRSTNAPSSFEFGPHVSDAIADWITKGFAYGPVGEDELPESAKVNGIMCRQKPNGSVRIILNFSSPVGNSVNEGIDEKEFPASMSSTTKWLRVLNRAGRGCHMVKVDWSDAYKHVAVRDCDLDLQWFSWLGKFFCELSLVFGSKSSVGLYDRLAKLVLFIVCKEADMPTHMVCQHLDDCAAAAPKDSPLIHRFDEVFKEVAELLGVKLAPRDDPEKSFGPSTTGIVFGVSYDTVKWSWSIPREKLVRILHQLQEGIDSAWVSQEYLMSVAGRIINIRPLIPLGRFHVTHILKAAGVSQEKSHMSFVTPELRAQLQFWLVMLRACDGNVSIPDPDDRLPCWALEFFTDASGGGFGADGLRSGRGVGAVALGWWAYVPWSSTICRGPLCEDGRRLNRKMSALELVGPLLVLSSGFALCKGKPVKIWVDNAGSVGIWRKGYSTTCALSTSLVLALATVASGIGCWVELMKITRCSNAGADMADALSKADFRRFWSLSDGAGFDCPVEPAWVPVSLIAWLESPCPDEGLGQRILGEISLRTDVLGFSV